MYLFYVLWFNDLSKLHCNTNYNVVMGNKITFDLYSQQKI